MFLLGDTPASESYVQQFRNNLFLFFLFTRPMKREQIVPKRLYIKSRRRRNTQKKELLYFRIVHRYASSSTISKLYIQFYAYSLFIVIYTQLLGDRGSSVVQVLCYKSEGRWFDSSWCHWNFSLTQNPSDRTMALGSTQPLTEMSTRSISWGV